MNPWQLLGDLLGWIVLAIVLTLTILFAYMVVLGAIRETRRPKRTNTTKINVNHTPQTKR